MPKYSTLLQKNLRAKTGEKVVRGHTLRFKNVFRSTGRKPQQFPQVGNIISFFTGEESPNGPVTSVERREKALKDARASQRANAGILTDKELRAKQLLKIKKKKEEAKQLAAERGIMIKMLRTTFNDGRNPYYVQGYDPAKEGTYIENDGEKGRIPLDEKISTEDLWGLIRKYVSKDDHIKRNFITKEAERVVKEAEFDNGPNELEAYYSGIDLGNPDNDGDRIISRPAVERITSFEPFTGRQQETDTDTTSRDTSKPPEEPSAKVDEKTQKTQKIQKIVKKYENQKNVELRKNNQQLLVRFLKDYESYSPSALENLMENVQEDLKSETQKPKDEQDSILINELEVEKDALEILIIGDPELTTTSAKGAIGSHLIPKISQKRVKRLFEMKSPLTIQPRVEEPVEEVENELNELKQRQRLYSERMKTLRGKTPPKGMVERAFPSGVLPLELEPNRDLTPYAFLPPKKAPRLHLFNI